LLDGKRSHRKEYNCVCKHPRNNALGIRYSPIQILPDIEQVAALTKTLDRLETFANSIQELKK
jgi:hypothetical protein